MIQILQPGEHPAAADLRPSAGQGFERSFVWYGDDGETPKWTSTPVGATAKFQIRETKESASLLLVGVTEVLSASGQIAFDTNGVVRVTLTPTGTLEAVLEAGTSYAFYGLTVTLQGEDPFRVAEGKYWYNYSVVY